MFNIHQVHWGSEFNHAISDADQLPIGYTVCDICMGLILAADLL
jgi:hypothetical protein